MNRHLESAIAAWQQVPAGLRRQFIESGVESLSALDGNDKSMYATAMVAFALLAIATGEMTDEECDEAMREADQESN